MESFGNGLKADGINKSDGRHVTCVPRLGHSNYRAMLSKNKCKYYSDILNQGFFSLPNASSTSPIRRFRSLRQITLKRDEWAIALPIGWSHRVFPLRGGRVGLRSARKKGYSFKDMAKFQRENSCFRLITLCNKYSGFKGILDHCRRYIVSVELMRWGSIFL